MKVKIRKARKRILIREDLMFANPTVDIDGKIYLEFYLTKKSGIEMWDYSPENVFVPIKLVDIFCSGKLPEELVDKINLLSDPSYPIIDKGEYYK